MRGLMFALRRLGKVLIVFFVCISALISGLALWMYSRYDAPVFDGIAARGITYTPPRQIVPGPGLPDDVQLYRANNNVDLALFHGRTYMAFRTAPLHFASSRARLIVVSSEDRVRWTRETEIALGADVREPRLLVFQDRLYLYFFEGGSDWIRFEPKSIMATEKTGQGWSEPVAVYDGSYVVWRVKARGDRAYMSVYNGESLYGAGDTPSDVRLLVSADGYHWEPAFAKAQVDEVGAEEADFEFDDEGNLVAVVRQEVRGGSLVCTAKKDNLGEWECRFSPYKVDSALLFTHGGDFYVIGRRNVAGPCDRGVTILGEVFQHAWNFAMYSMTRKRTALYKVDLERKRMIPLFDFSSKGDTAFAGLAPLDESRYYVVNYSSPIDGADWPWLAGQFLDTRLYETVLRFPSAR